MQRTAVRAFGAVLLMSACFAFAQQHAAIPPDLKFEVASLKPSQPDGVGGGIRPAAGGQRYEAVNCPLTVMIQAAYRIKAEQIVGGPVWIGTERFDMKGIAARPSNADELHIMLMNLIVERFHLKFHKDKKEMSMYALTVDKGGPHLTPHEAANAGEMWIDQTLDGIVHVKMKATFSPMEYFAFRLSNLMDRPVVDLTNLKGGYDFNFEYTTDLPPGLPENPKVNGEPVDTDGPNVYAALKQQLGLNLKAQRGPVDIIVIDHVEKPVEN
jgi:uncharacterized protein (TIGR03435 family)